MGKNGIGVLFASIAFVAILAGCSGEGNLTVKNEGTTEFQGYVENQSVIINPEASYTTSIYIGKTLGFIGPTDLPVTITGSAATKRAFSEDVTVTRDETTTYRIIDDVGALNFTNAFSLQVNAVSMKMCDSTQFGPNLLPAGHPVAPGTAKVIQVDPACWDILVNYGREEFLDTLFAIPVDVGQVINIAWIPGYVYTP